MIRQHQRELISAVDGCTVFLSISLPFTNVRALYFPLGFLLQRSSMVCCSGMPFSSFFLLRYDILGEEHYVRMLNIIGTKLRLE